VQILLLWSEFVLLGGSLRAELETLQRCFESFLIMHSAINLFMAM
jgi:hypothetical protein